MTDISTTETPASPEWVLALMLPEVSKVLREATIIARVFALCGTPSQPWVFTDSAPIPDVLRVELEAALVELNACLQGEQDRAWCSYLSTAKAMVCYRLYAHSNALAALVQARDDLDRRYRMYASFGYFETIHYLWLLARIAEVSEIFGDLELVVKALEELLEKSERYDWRVKEALSGKLEVGNIGGWSRARPATESGSPLPELWRRLANACFQLYRYEKVVRFLECLRQTGFELDDNQREQFGIAAEHVALTVVRV